RPRATTTTAIIAGDVPPPDTQQLSSRPAVLREITVPRESAPDVVARSVLEDPKVQRYEIDRDDDGGLIVRLHIDRDGRTVDESVLRDDLEAIMNDDSIEVVHIDRHRSTATQEVLLRSPIVEG